MVSSMLPLKPLVFQVLVSLSEGERHGWSLVREVQLGAGGDRIMPANFYRTLRTMMADGLIEESARRKAADDDERRRYFKLTPFGQDAARAEARRLHELVSDARTKKLLKKSS